jgi:hypothetical protein
MSSPPPTGDFAVRLAPPSFVFLWATGFVVARLVAPWADPLTFLSLRFVIAAACLALIAVAVRAPWPASAAAWRNGLVAGVLLHGVYLGAVFWAIKQGMPAGISALLAGLQPLVTGMLVGPLLGEAVSRRRWLGIGLGFWERSWSSRRNSAPSTASRRSQWSCRCSAPSRSRSARSGRSAPRPASICAPTRWRSSSARRSSSRRSR